MTTVDTFLTALKTVVEGIDPNIGAFFETHRIWRQSSEMKNDNAVFIVSDPSVLDTADRHGQNVTRFWFTDIQSEPEPLTNCSVQYKHTLKLTAFYQWEQDNSQEQTLRNACLELLDKLNEQATQTGTLNTGEQYLGYLESPPRMVGGVEYAEIGEGAIAGHTAVVEVTFYEEVPTA